MMGKETTMEQYVIRKTDLGEEVVSDRAPRSGIRIGHYLAEDGTPLVTVGDIILGRLPDLVDAMSRTHREFRMADAIRTIQELA